MRNKNTFRSITCSDGTTKNFSIMADGSVSLDIISKAFVKWHIYLGNMDDKECANALPRYHQYCFESGKHYMR